MLMELDVARAEREIAGAADYLLLRPECTSKTFGVVGFCMGGALAQHTATHNPKTGAAVSFYGGFKKVSTPWESLNARSEERRVGKECRSRWSAYHEKKKIKCR